MKKIITLLLCALSLTGMTKVAEGVPDCGEVFEAVAGKLQAEGWVPVAQPEAPFFILIIQDTFGNPGAILVVPEMYANAMLEAADKVEVLMKTQCVVAGQPHLFLTIKEKKHAI